MFVSLAALDAQTVERRFAVAYRVPNVRHPLCSPEVGTARQRVSEKGSNSCPCVALSSLEPSRVHLGHMLTVLPSLCVFRYNGCNVLDVPRRRPRRRPALWTRQEQERHINGTRDSTDQSMCSEPEALPRTHTCKVTLVGGYGCAMNVMFVCLLSVTSTLLLCTTLTCTWISHICIIIPPYIYVPPYIIYLV